jgi:3-deoxy-D-manno-octulosonic-acid transferase
MGEVNVASAYADALRSIAPLYLTVQTQAGLETANRLMPGVPHGFAPFDSPANVRRFISNVSPRALVLFETEIWPNWLRTFSGPIWFANARLSQKSYRNYRMVRPAVVPLWRNVRGVFAQSDNDRKRFIALGVPLERVQVAGQIKQSQQLPAPAPELRAQWRARLGVRDDEHLWVCGSVRPDEVTTVLRLWKHANGAGLRARLVLAPRHLNRVQSTLDVAAQIDVPTALVSRLNGNGVTPDVFILDSHGDLASLYAAADLALLGGTFAPHGGHNPNEAALHGVPVITGPYTNNIEADVALLSRAGLCYRLENLTDFPVLVRSLKTHSPDTACSRLRSLLAERPDPAKILLESMRAELCRAL